MNNFFKIWRHNTYHGSCNRVSIHGMGIVLLDRRYGGVRTIGYRWLGCRSLNTSIFGTSRV